MPICLDCMRKPLEIKNFPGGGPLDPFTVKYFFLSNFKPPPLTEKVDPPLKGGGVRLRLALMVIQAKILQKKASFKNSGGGSCLSATPQAIGL